MLDLRHAQVVKFNGDGTANIILLDNGWPASSVPIMGGVQSSKAGEFEEQDIDPPTTPPTLVGPGQRYSLAAVARLNGGYVIVGFMPPVYSENIFPGRALKRYSSDVYTSIDSQGNVEVYHPSGAYIRMGTSPAHEDLTGKDAGRRFNLTRNKGKALFITVANATAGQQTAMVQMDPLGNVDVQAKGTATVDAAAVQLQAAQVIIFSAPSIVFNSQNAHHTGAVTSDKDFSVGPVSLIQHGHQVVTETGPGIAQTPVGGGPGAPTFGASTNPTAATRGLRNNNPGNLRAIPGTTFQGQIGVDEQGFMIFSNSFSGTRALALDLLNQQQQHGLDTVTDIITKFAPPGENNTTAYIAAVSSQMGVDPNATLDLTDPTTLTNFTAAVIKQENGVQPFTIMAPPSAPMLPGFPTVPNVTSISAAVSAAQASIIPSA